MNNAHLLAVMLISIESGEVKLIKILFLKRKYRDSKFNNFAIFGKIVELILN